mgnify:CR=1 FL=1
MSNTETSPVKKNNNDEIKEDSNQQVIELSNISLEEDDTMLDEKEEFKRVQKDQDQEQKYKVYFLFMIEIFKVAMASFLSISVVQKCDDSICTFSENLDRKSGYGNMVIAVNTANILAFGILYFIEFNILSEFFFVLSPATV